MQPFLEHGDVKVLLQDGYPETLVNIVLPPPSLMVEIKQHKYVCVCIKLSLCFK
jgi:hypothetical protein